MRYLAAAVPARRGLGDDLQSCAVLLLVGMRLELKYSRVAVSRAAHATHSHEYGGVIQLIVMSQAACFNSTRLTLIMKRVVPWYMSPLTVICCAFSMRRPASSYCRLSDGRIASVSPSRVAVRSSAWDERAQPKAEGRERREGGTWTISTDTGGAGGRVADSQK